MKKFLPYDPKMVITDFSPSLMAPIKKVFPNAELGHDYFHTAKLLNKGMLKELSRVQRKEYSSKIAEFNKFRNLTILAEEKKSLSKMSSTVPFLKSAITLYGRIFSIYISKSLDEFRQKWIKFKIYCTTHKIDAWLKITSEIEDKCPACGFTSKNFKKFGKMLCQKWRAYIRTKRIELEKEKGEFSRAKYHILRNPRNMTSYHKRKLRKALKKFPFLREYRQVIVKFHHQFNLKEDSNPSLNFLKTIIKKDTHPRLCSAVNTLIKEKDGIFKYREILKKYPHLKKGKSIRSNHEQLNRKVNKVARDQYGFRSIKNICRRVEGILNCPIIVSKIFMQQEV
jgi:transposase